MKNYSRQREEIIKVVKEFSTHPTAEEILPIMDKIIHLNKLLTENRYKED